MVEIENAPKHQSDANEMSSNNKRGRRVISIFQSSLDV